MRRSFVAVVVSWLVVVAIGSTLVWAVISRVGDGLAATDSSFTPSASSGVSRPPSTEPTRTTSPSSSPPSGEPTPTTSPPSSSPPSSPSSPSSSTTSSPGPRPQRATWQGQGGTVVAECTGSAIRQLSASADPGYRVEVGNPGPEELEVEFEGREDEEGSHSHVRAVCVGGAPKFSVETDD